MKAKELYEEVYVPAWTLHHEGSSPNCFEDWANNDFRQAIAEFLDDLDFEGKVALLSYRVGEEITCDIPSPTYMEDIENEGSFLEVYDRIDHENFNPRHNLYWYENGGDTIVSGDEGAFVDEYWDDEDMTDFVVAHFDKIMEENESLLDEFLYEI